MNGNELMIFKDENNNQIELSSFSTNVKLQDDKVLIIKHAYVAVPTKKQNILMISDREEGDNKLGVGRIIGSAANVNNLSAGDHVIFNKWNNCLEFHHQSNVYYIVKASEVHAVLNVKILPSESKN